VTTGNGADTEGEPEAPHFIRPRIVVGLLLFSLVCVLAIFDALSPDYALDSIQLALMLGTGGVILGVEPLSKLLR
jgi:hypothetical protein